METLILLVLFIIFAGAKLAGEICRRLHQPSVIGEIIFGMLLGPLLLKLAGDAHTHEVFTETLNVFAEIGVIILLFVVGLETRISEMLRVGRTALAVAISGVILPFGLGLALMLGLHQQVDVALFIATALVATSVGITARVLSELRQTASRPALVILGAAVIDDILGLIVLSIVSGISDGQLSAFSIGLTIVEAAAFTVFVLFIGGRAAHRVSAHFSRLRIAQPAFVIPIALCLGLSALAAHIGLAAIVGAFLAGMVFAETKEAPTIQRSMDEVYALMVPIFFVVMGTKVDIYSFARPEVLILGLMVTLLAIIGKVVGCGLAAYKLGRQEAAVVGIAMMPRGEVGIVVASIGLSRGIINDDIYSIVIFMSIITTLIAPPLLRLALSQPKKASHPALQSASESAPPPDAPPAPQ